MVFLYKKLYASISCHGMPITFNNVLTFLYISRLNLSTRILKK